MKKNFYIKALLLFTTYFTLQIAQGQSSQYYEICKRSIIPRTTIWDIVQDDNGFIWFATQSGLWKYDGENTTEFVNEPWNKNSLPSDEVRALKHSSGKLVIGTRSGSIAIFDPISETFTRHYLYDKDKKPITFIVYDMKEDKLGKVWFGTSLGLLIYANDTLQHWNDINKTPESQLNFPVISIVFDKNNSLWLGRNNSISRIIFTNEKLSPLNATHHIIQRNISRCNYLEYDNKDRVYYSLFNDCGYFNINDPESIMKSFIIDKKEDYSFNSIHLIDSNICIGTNKGLIKIDPKGEISTEMQKYDIVNVTTDVQNNIWIGTRKNGAIIKTPNSNQFAIYQDFTNNKNQQLHNVRAILKRSGKDEIWCGFHSEGILIKKPTKKTQTQITLKDGLLDLNIRSLKEDNKGNIWIGTLQGVQIYNPRNNTFKTITDHKNRDLKTCFRIKENKNSTWFSEGNDLYQYHNKIIRHINLTTITDLPIQFIRDFEFGNDNDLWIATDSHGLINYSLTDQSYTLYKHSSDDINSLGSEKLFCLLFEKKINMLWIGTSNGISLLNTTTKVFSHFFKKDGLSGRMVYGILKDNNNKLWISCDYGLNKFNASNRSFEKYLSEYRFLDDAFSKDQTGKLYFGGNEHVVVIPTEFKNQILKSTSPKLTHISINNEELRAPLAKNMRITRKYNQNGLSFTFSSMNFSDPQNCTYYYKLEGFDKEWNSTPSQVRGGIYNLLPPGTYTLKLKTTHSNNSEVEITEALELVITVPFWGKIWFFLAILLSIILLIILVVRIQNKRHKQQKIRLHEIIEEKTENLRNMNIILSQQKEQIEEMSETKIRFFTNISHELKTPLTLIKAPAKSLLAKCGRKKELIPYIKFIDENADRLLTLINQLLIINKAEKDRMELVVEPFNIVDFTNEIIKRFIPSAEEKEITLNTIDYADLEIYLDKDKLNKILSNLLINALKNTTYSGTIRISISQNEEFVSLSLSDTGIGMSKETLDKIFNHFYSSKYTDNKGSGIGLTYCKSLIECQGGIINVTSEENVGSEFIISFKKGKSHFNEEDFNDFSKARDYEELILPTSQAKKNIETNPNIDLGKPSLLVVDDDSNIRDYLKMELESDYSLYSATNGQEAIDLVNENNIDLILSDIMMPIKNGYQLCKEIKENEATANIPIILLTAQGMEERKIESYQTGADAFINKPFTTAVLKARIENLLAGRQNLKNKYSHGLYKDTSDTHQVDKEFLNKLTNIILKEIKNEDLSVEYLSSQMGMSRSNLFRKVKKLTEKTPIQYIRTIRLKRSLQLLNKGYTIKQTCYETGFNNVIYFRKVFSQEFGSLPSENQ